MGFVARWCVVVAIGLFFLLLLRISELSHNIECLQKAMARTLSLEDLTTFVASEKEDKDSKPKTLGEQPMHQ